MGKEVTMSMGTTETCQQGKHANREETATINFKRAATEVMWKSREKSY